MDEEITIPFYNDYYLSILSVIMMIRKVCIY